MSRKIEASVSDIIEYLPSESFGAGAFSFNLRQRRALTVALGGAG
jgi:hypothetical protein